MPYHEDEARRLRDLHDAYVWKVNAAIEDGRENLARQLADGYLDEAVRMMSDGPVRGCGRSGCSICVRHRAAPARQVSRRGGWRRLFAARRPAAS